MGRDLTLTRRGLLARAATLAAGGTVLMRTRGAGALQRAPSIPERVLSAGGRTFALPSAVFGGELQYFRMSPSAVQARLALCREAEFTVVQTYVPWNVHEFLPGRLDFEGHTHPVLPDDHLDEYQEQTPVDELQTGGVDGRAGLLCNTNLVSFLAQCRDLGLAVILRPGPFISDEWRNGGLPDWFLNTAPPEMYAYGPDGTPLSPGAPNGSWPVANVTGGQTLFYFPSPSYASSHYLAGARRWLSAFATFVGPWLATRGGPVIAVQVDDESCFFYRFGPFEVDYNPAMLARYAAAGGGSAPRAWPPPAAGVGALRTALSWQAFKGRQVGAYLAALRADLLAAGVDVPITHELELSLTPPADFADDAGAAILNPELYPGGSGPETMPLIELTAQAARAAQRNRVNVWAAEQESDILKFLLLIGEGIIGGIPFDYTQGIATGDVGDRSRLGRTLRAAGRRLSEARRHADVAIVWDNSLTRVPYGSQRWGFAADVRRVIEQHVPALATLLLRAGLAFDLLDVEAAAQGDYDPATYRTIFLAAADILPRAAQQSLADYVRRGGRLVCWPAPPTLDEELNPCTLLADDCYPERRDSFHPEDAQLIEVLGRPVVTWLGVQTFTLSVRARAIATRAGRPCGYTRRHGRGEAVLLGTWLAADSVPGRAGSILESQSLPAGSSDASALARARDLADRRLGPAAAAHLPDTLPGGAAQELLVYAYTNERRGGEVISGGALAYWDGENVVGLLELNTTAAGTGVSAFPHHPIEPPAIAAVLDLGAVAPRVRVSDQRVQARLLSAPEGRAATIVACNRWDAPVELVVHSRLAGSAIRLPTRGALPLPAGTGILLPIGYRLGGGVTLLQATAQLTGFQVSGRSVTLGLWSPSGDSEVLLALPERCRSLALDGRRLAGPARPRVRIVVPAGDHTLTAGW